ncbi:MAG: alanyl-tRNA editing protein [Anaerolineales bacterium]|nr:alanyl-tRNA editing protein [Anaerolineales bacterium]
MSRLYYDNAYLREFSAMVLEQTTHEGLPAVVLSDSAFYPTSGGQPNDLGTLNGVAVLDVVTAGDTEPVLHITGQPLGADSVQGVIDWGRRFDHMQHHTGQHILTRAFINAVEAPTVSFHLSENSVTIDLDRADVTPVEVDAAEDLANHIIAENRPVRAWFPSPDELAALQLRKISDKVTGAVRVIDIGGFDVTACGGTHVAHTGEVGLIKVIRLDSTKGKTRVEFRCGQRALEDYRAKNTLLHNLMAQLTTGVEQIPDVIEKMREENKALNRILRATQEELMGYQAERLWQAASNQASGEMVIVSWISESLTPRDLQQLANQLVAHPQTVALLGIYGDAGHLLLARSAELELDMVPLLKQGLSSLGSQKGGGRPNLAQGGGVPVTESQLQAVLTSIEGAIRGA